MAKKKEKKEKKAGKRMSKKELAALLIDFFHAKSSETLSMKYIFSELRLCSWWKVPGLNISAKH